MFTIQKDLNGIFWHIYNNARTRVNVSDFDVVIDDVSNTFIIQCKNGSNIPNQAISISLIQVIDLSVGTSPILFSGANGLIQLLTAKGYTPYLQVPPSVSVVVYRVGQVGVFTMTPTQFTDNFTETGLGTNTMLGWALRNGNNGTKNQQGKFSLNKGVSPYDVIGTLGGSANSVLIDHKHATPKVMRFYTAPESGAFWVDTDVGSGSLVTLVQETQMLDEESIHSGETGAGKNMPPYLIDVWVERVTELVINSGSGGGGGIQSIVAGTNITVDDSDPQNPIVSASGGVTQDLAMVLAVDNKTNDIPIVSNNENGYAFILDDRTIVGNDFGGEKNIKFEEDTFTLNSTVRYLFNGKGIDIGTTSDGLGLPRLTTTQMNAIVAPTEGMIVYNTTESATYQYNGATWVVLGANAVDSVNGQTGVVVLDAADVGADAITSATTGAVISFATPQIYNSIASPSSSNLTDSLTGARIGIVQKIYHNSGTAPTVPAGWVLRGTGAYVTSTLNIIYAEWSVGTTVEYWITQ